MALISCPKCGGAISTHAKECPHCRAPFIMKKDWSGGLFATDNPIVVCATCGYHGVPSEKKASPVIGLLLLLFYILPGLIYFAWRESAAKKVCPQCGATTLIPASTPMARKILADLNPS